MGMFDHVTCELAMPDGREMARNSFQTKSLWCCMDLFTITEAGRLIFHKRRYSTTEMPVHLEDIDTGYHGDLEMHGSVPDGAYARYAVRFTHGSVEWIQPLEELTEVHRSWLMERG